MNGIGLIAVCLYLLTGAPATAASVTPEQCEADYQAMLDASADNRSIALAEIQLQMLNATPDQKVALEEIEEQVWMQEEQHRRQAGFYKRDCLKAAKSK